MSGGVDSAVAALRLLDEGRRVETVTLRLWGGGEGGTCALDDGRRAAATAASLGLPHHVLDLEAAFEDAVVRAFERGYLAGDTPNPCAVCNPLRLAELVRFADRLGLGSVATGHYARLVWRSGEPYVARAADRSKDQSYMLWAVPPDVLRRLEFPLGDLSKPEARALASGAGLQAAEEPESQEVCFAVDGYQDFLSSRGVAPKDGDIVDRDGRLLGTHHGHWRYTVGQRRGLGVSADEPLYVLERKAAENQVVVGGRDALESRHVWLDGLVDRDLGDGHGLEAQLRYRSAPVPVAAMDRRGPGSLHLELTRTFSGLAPGQAAVLYRDDVIVGGGTIGRVPEGVVG